MNTKDNSRETVFELVKAVHMGNIVGGGDPPLRDPATVDPIHPLLPLPTSPSQGSGVMPAGFANLGVAGGAAAVNGTMAAISQFLCDK